MNAGAEQRKEEADARPPGAFPMVRHWPALLRRLDGVGRIAVFLAAFALVAVPMQLVAPGSPGRGGGLLGNAGPGRVVTYCLFLLLAFLFHRAASPGRYLGLHRYSGWTRTILKGWLFGIAGFLLYALMMHAAGVVDFRVPKSVADALGAVAVSLVAGFGVAAVEEVLFRGFLLRTAAESLPKWPAILLTGVVFGFFHDLASPAAFFTNRATQMLFGGVFCLHVMLCLCAIRTRSLHLGIGIHAGLVFGESLVRKLRIFDVAQDDSFWWGLNADPRRGVCAWLLFLASIAAVPLLAGARERANAEAREPVAFAPAWPAWLVRLLQWLSRPSPRIEAAGWTVVAALAFAPRLFALAALPFPLLHYHSDKILEGAAALAAGQWTAGDLPGGPLFSAILAALNGRMHLLPWIQHAAVVAGLGAGFAALRCTLGRGAALPLMAAAVACVSHGGSIHVAHHVLAGALRFALMAAVLAAWALRLWRGRPAFAALAALFAGLNALAGLHLWILVAVIALRELAEPDAIAARLRHAGLVLAAALAPVVMVAPLLPDAALAALGPSRVAVLVYGGIAHLDPRPPAAPPALAETLAPLIEPMAALPDDDRRLRFYQKVIPALTAFEPDEARRNRLCISLFASVAATHPRATLAIAAKQGRSLFLGGGRNIEWPGAADLSRTTKIAKGKACPAVKALGREARQALASPAWNAAPERASPDGLAWLLVIAPPFSVATVLLLAAAFVRRRPALRWFSAGCLSVWLPFLAVSTMLIERNERDFAGVLPVAMAPIAAAAALAWIAAVRALESSGGTAEAC